MRSSWSQGQVIEPPEGGEPLPAPDRSPTRFLATAGWLNRHAHGLIAAILGLLAIRDALRIQQDVRPGSSGFGVVGPDGYLLAVGVLLVAAAVVHGSSTGLMAFRRNRQNQNRATEPFGQQTPEQSIPEVAVETPSVQKSRSRAVLILALLLVVYAFSIPIFGYSIATFVVLIPVARVVGSSWRMALLVAAALTIFNYLVFIELAGMPLPEMSLFG